MYTINSRWVDDKKVYHLGERMRHHIGGVTSLYPSYVGQDLYIVVKKKNLSASLYARVCMCVRIYVRMWSVLSLALYLPFFSLAVPRLKVRVSMSPLSWTLCVQGILIRLRRLSQQDRLFAGLAHATYIDGEHH